MSNAISGYEYSENLKTYYLYNNLDWKVTRGNYRGYNDNYKC